MRGDGGLPPRRSFDPGLLTALLIYGYCQGVRSSRQIERACVTDVAFRVIAAQQQPDHTTVRLGSGSGMRRRWRDLFGQVLAMCGAGSVWAGVGIVAIDGTKIAGQASPRKNYTENTLRRLSLPTSSTTRPPSMPPKTPNSAPSGPAMNYRKICGRARTGQRGSGTRWQRWRRRRLRRPRRTPRSRNGNWAAREELPPGNAMSELRRREGRRPRVDRMRLDEQVKVRRADARVAATEQELAQAKDGQGPRARTARPVRNISDPDSHVMFVRGKGYLQGYNGQLAVSDDHLIVATGISDQHQRHAAVSRHAGSDGSQRSPRT